MTGAGASGRLTVAICTWNRAERLRETLEAMARVREPAGWEWELVVVDNGSDDGTSDVLEALRDRIPLRPVHEPRLGLSHARNRAVAEATGEWIVWTDDDVLVPEEWLVGYTRAFRRFPDAAFFGGGVEPHFLEPPPRWVEEAWPDVAPLLAVRGPPADGARVRTDSTPCGANLALRADAQRRHPYDPGLGRKGPELRSGEEWAVLSALLEGGEEGRWVEGIAVRHVLPPERLTLEHLGGIVRCEGRVGAGPLPQGWVRAGLRTAFLWHRWLLATAHAGLARRLTGASTWVPAYLHAQRARGSLDRTPQ